MLFIAIVVINGNETTASRTSISHDVVSSAKLKGCALLGRQFCALFAKRFHYVLRSKKAFFTQVSSFIKA